MTTVTVNPDATEQTRPRTRPVPDQTQATVFPSRHHVPITMPSTQEYYWKSAWQQGEREARRELERGGRLRFDSDDPEDVARWLDAPDDADTD